MHPFDYARPQSEADAIGALAEHPDAAFLAGGTTLIDLMKLDVQKPAHLIDIGGLPLTTVAEHDGGVMVGALVKNSDMANHPLIKINYPALSQALLSGASPQLRNMATTGGNLLQRTRCYYFRDQSMPCNKREPGSGCSAIEGCNRIHAVLGTSRHCIATHPSDMCVALTALDAIIVTNGLLGERRIPITQFYVEPGDHPERENVLQYGELIVGVLIPAISFGRRSTYLKVRDRASYEFALASAAVVLDLEAGVIRQSRIALGGVATMPWRARAAEEHLAGQPSGPDAYRAAAEIAMRDAKKQKDNGFKIELAKQTIVRALTVCAEMT